MGRFTLVIDFCCDPSPPSKGDKPMTSFYDHELLLGSLPMNESGQAATICEETASTTYHLYTFSKAAF